jgi:hypothetical protein
MRSLAPSVTCVNFYRATETPQAMAYYIVPTEGTADSAKQTETEKSPNPLIPAPHSQFPNPYRIPAGRGIKDVQLLVLNREQQLALLANWERFMFAPPTWHWDTWAHRLSAGSDLLQIRLL